MSYSGLIEQTYLLQVASLAAVVDKYKKKWASANTVEDQVAVEAEAIDSYLTVDNEHTVSEVSEFEHLDQVDLDNFYGLYDLLQRANTGRLQVANQMLLTRLNNYQLMFSDLVGQVKRIRQKKAVLSLWNGERAKYLVGEKFLNTDKLAFNFTSVDPCEVNINQGILTLPVSTSTELTVSTIRAGALSNGNPGNSDVAVTTNNQDLRSLITKSSDTFEYERLDSGPCTLVLIIELPRPQIVNHVSITPADIGAPISFDVKDIVYTSSNKTSVSVHDLLPVEGKEVFQVEATAFSGPWELTHLPQEAVSVAIHLEQTAAYQIRTISSDKRKVLRDRYAIPLKAISLSQIQYKQTGGINSLPAVIRKNLYALEPKVTINPNDAKFYDFTIEISFDDGVTWISTGTDEQSIITLIKENNGFFVWRLVINRVTDAFNSFSSFGEEESVKNNITSIIRNASRLTSPTTVHLTSKPTDEPQVIQTKLGRRGNKSKAFKLGTIQVPGTNKLPVPFNVLHKKIKPSEVDIYVGGVRYLRREPGEVLSAIEWSFADKHDEVLIPDLDPGTQIDMILSEELMLLEEREDGFYHKTKLDFDPDKTSIEVNYLSREPARKSVVLPRGQTIIYLDTNNILNGTLSIVSTSGATYTEVTSRDEIYDEADNDYFVDYENGVLYLAEAISNDPTRASFDYQTKFVLGEEQFDVVYEDSLPTHIRIKKNALEAVAVTESISDENLPIIDPLTGTYGVREVILPNGLARRKQLTNNYIIINSFQAPVDLLENELIPEEVPFIDGITEFLGLTEITNEKTNRLTADSSGVVSFALSARSLWYRDLDVVFSNTSVFVDKRNTQNQVVTGNLGDYFIDADGTVYVQVDPFGVLPANIKMSYYYKNPQFEGANKYSVDYERGILHSFRNLNQNAQVSYKTATYTVSYDIAKKLQARYSTETNSVDIRTEHMHPINNVVKVIWNQNNESQVNESIVSFFSPLVSLVGFRFS